MVRFLLIVFCIGLGVGNSYAAATTSLYRLFNSKSGDHFYTTSAAEKDAAVQSYGYVYEGVAGYVYSSAEINTVPLYRLQNSKSGDHFYTTSASEKDASVQNDGYVYEGIAAYLFASKQSSSNPLYRLFNSTSGDHFYTVSASEKDAAVKYYGYTYEGVAGYLPSQTDVVMNTTFSKLKTFHGSCTSTQAYSDFCFSAINAYCRADGYATGFGPVEHNGDSASVVCMPSSSAKVLASSYSALRAYHSSCTTAKSYGDACNSAINAYCQKRGYKSGYGPTDHYGDAANVACVSNAVVINTTYSTLKTHHSGCTTSSSFGDSCNAAINRFCQAKGYVSGFGPTDHVNDYVNVACIPSPPPQEGSTFLWGTEGGGFESSSTAQPVTNAINNSLGVQYVKYRIHQSMVSLDGVNFTSSGCMPSLSTCTQAFNLDSIVAIFKANGWSMVPMLSHDISKKSFSDADIDKFVNFVDWFVSRYKTDANIKLVELINSPATWFISGSNGTLAQLLQLNNRTYEKIKTKYPDIFMGTPGFEYSDNAPTSPNPSALVEYFLNKVHGAKFDFWAFHGYPLMHINPSTGGVIAYPPTQSPGNGNKYAGIPGILEIRKSLNANGWNQRMIIDTEHIGVTPPTVAGLTSSNDHLDAAYMVQELLLKRTLKSGSQFALQGLMPYKILPRGDTGEFLYASLTSTGSPTQALQAGALLKSKMEQYEYSGNVSGQFDNDQQPWIEKFVSSGSSGNVELYICFKPFKTGAAVAFDNQSVFYWLTLKQQPKSASITDISGVSSNVTGSIYSASVVLQCENSPKFLEVTY